ncbi:SPRY domain-containing SOCS box protein SSB-4, partial [Aphelenchoides avenae]
SPEDAAWSNAPLATPSTSNPNGYAAAALQTARRRGYTQARHHFPSALAGHRDGAATHATSEEHDPAALPPPHHQHHNELQQRARVGSTSSQGLPSARGIRDGIARNLIEFARGTPTRNQQRRVTQAKSALTGRSISPAHPVNFNTYVTGDGMRPYKLDVILNMPPPSQDEMERHSWNPDDRSLNIYVKEDDRLTLHRHPVAQSTDCIRGKVGFANGFHVWQICWPSRMRGTHAVVGVATKTAPLHSIGYTSLVGANSESFGWDLVRNKCFHDSKNTSSWVYPSSSVDVEEGYHVPDKFYVILDMDEGYMAYASEKQFLGVAFRGLKGKVLYPAISAVWGHCEVTMKYMGGLDPEPRQLMDICRRTIRMQLGRHRLDRVDELRLPPALQRYLLYTQ